MKEAIKIYNDFLLLLDPYILQGLTQEEKENIKNDFIESIAAGKIPEYHFLHIIDTMKEFYFNNDYVKKCALWIIETLETIEK